MDKVPATPPETSWRDVIPVHPAADVFPLLPPDELKDLADDIKANGLNQEVVMSLGADKQLYLLDGRNRLDAMELAGLESVIDDWLAFAPDSVFFHPRIIPDNAAVAYVISANIKRRHLTKQQQAALIVEVVKAAESDSAKLAKSPSPSKGKQDSKGGGSTKDPVKLRVVEEAAKHGISERTAERALVEAEPERKRSRKSPTDAQTMKAEETDEQVTPKQALSVLRGIAEHMEYHAWAFDAEALGDLERLAADPEAQAALDQLRDANREISSNVRRLERYRKAKEAAEQLEAAEREAGQG